MKLGAIRLLSRLRFRQFFRQKNKGLVGKIIIIAYCPHQDHLRA